MTLLEKRYTNFDFEIQSPVGWKVATWERFFNVGRIIQENGSNLGEGNREFEISIGRIRGG